MSPSEFWNTTPEEYDAITHAHRIGQEQEWDRTRWLASHVYRVASGKDINPQDLMLLPTLDQEEIAKRKAQKEKARSILLEEKRKIQQGWVDPMIEYLNKHDELPDKVPRSWLE